MSIAIAVFVTAGCHCTKIEKCLLLFTANTNILVVLYTEFYFLPFAVNVKLNLAIIVGFPCTTASLLNNDNGQTCLRDGKTLKVVLCTKFCLLCDKQVISSVLGQLRINFT